MKTRIFPSWDWIGYEERNSFNCFDEPNIRFRRDFGPGCFTLSKRGNSCQVPIAGPPPVWYNENMTVTVELINEGAINLLRDMEALGLLHVNGKKLKPKAGKFAPASPDGIGIVGECPICAQHPKPNAKTIAAFKEGDAMLRGEIPSITYKSADEMWKDLLS
ncbi:MAG: hypothetical protein LBD09_03220 [Treponema sp.]|nr:hypothetical protein [Treponema sp.]